MNIPRLIICPKITSNKPENLALIKQAVNNINLTGDEFSDNKFYTGDAFLSLLTFLGCAPNINLSPKDGDNFCYIEFKEITGEAEMLGHTGSIIPLCLDCKHKLKHWQSIKNYMLAKTSFNCPECNTLLKISELKWRREAGYGQFYISIANIYSHEAVPSEKLLQTLEQTTGFAWHYFYANNPITGGK